MTTSTQRHRPPWLLPVIGAVLVIGTIIALGLASQPAPGDSALPRTPAAGDPQPVGGTLGCRQLPRFVIQVGFTGQSALSTGERGLKGLTLVDVADPSHHYQHPSWSQFGFLGPITYDAAGNVYVAPTANISLLDNPPEQQNTIYKADTDSGVLSEYLKLPPAAPLTTQNPFGILGLTYDCDTHSLYASSVAGSTRRQELGQIVRIDSDTGQVLDRLPGTDAIGLAIFQGPHGKRLYFGPARSPEVRSVALDEQGRFSGPARLEFKMPGLADKVRRLVFDAQGGLQLVGVPFDFTLTATSDELQSQYHFAYDEASDTWSHQPEP